MLGGCILLEPTSSCACLNCNCSFPGLSSHRINWNLLEGSGEWEQELRRHIDLERIKLVLAPECPLFRIRALISSSEFKSMSMVLIKLLIIMSFS